MAKRAPEPAGKQIELRDGLPRYPHEDVDFIVRELPKYQPCSVAHFVKQIGHDPRPTGSTSAVYQRVLAAFRLALSMGRVQNYMGAERKWIVTPPKDAA